ncbi:MAG: nucleotidyltransferase domain-containing protein [Candidatus Omnitrophica bacterium]|nr:nucleotidyltransferase domain-containing protein [Candidatus Omnitrophota bacterium]
MTTDEYLQAVINRNIAVTGDASPAALAGNAVYQIANQWAGNQLRSATYSGSYAKGTAVRGQTDVDIFMSLRSDTSTTLREIFEGLHSWMVNRGYPSARQQNVSIHVNHRGVEVDLVPGVHYGDNTEYHWLYVNKANRHRTQTNISLHIDTVRRSGRIREIVLTKIWKKNHALDFPSFYLELIVLEALKYSRASLSDSFWAVLQYLEENFLSSRIVDPANSNNIISDDLTEAEKRVVSNKAGESRHQRAWERIVW